MNLDVDTLNQELAWAAGLFDTVASLSCPNGPRIQMSCKSSAPLERLLTDVGLTPITNFGTQLIYKAANGRCMVGLSIGNVITILDLLMPHLREPYIKTRAALLLELAQDASKEYTLTAALNALHEPASLPAANMLITNDYDWAYIAGSFAARVRFRTYQGYLPIRKMAWTAKALTFARLGLSYDDFFLTQKVDEFLANIQKYEIRSPLFDNDNDNDNDNDETD